MTITRGARSASAAAWLAVRANAVLPVIALSTLPGAKVNPQEKLTLFGTVKSAAPATLRTAWSALGPAAPNLTAPGVAGTELSSQSLVVLPGALRPGASVRFRLDATDSGGSSFAEVVVPVSGVPVGTNSRPAGTVSVSPLSGFGLSTAFTLAAQDWTDSDLPLFFAFAYSVDGSDAPPVTLQDFQPLPALAGAQLPAGVEEGGFILRVFVIVRNGAACSRGGRALALFLLLPRVVFDSCSSRAFPPLGRCCGGRWALPTRRGLTGARSALRPRPRPQPSGPPRSPPPWPSESPGTRACGTAPPRRRRWWALSPPARTPS